MKAAMKPGCLSLAAKLSLMSVTTCMDVNLSNKALKAIMRRGSSSLAATLPYMSVTAWSNVTCRTKR